MVVMALQALVAAVVVLLLVMFRVLVVQAY
jgi:hypothetical protein